MAGVDVMEQSARRSRQVLEPSGRTKWPSRARSPRRSATGFRSVNVALRKELDLYAMCIRPEVLPRRQVQLRERRPGHRP